MRNMSLSEFRKSATSDWLDGRIILRHYNDPKAIILPIDEYNELIEYRKLMKSNNKLLSKIHDKLKDNGQEEIYRESVQDF